MIKPKLRGDRAVFGSGEMGDRREGEHNRDGKGKERGRERWRDRREGERNREGEMEWIGRDAEMKRGRD